MPAFAGHTTGHVGARLRRDDPQKPGFGISSRGHPDQQHYAMLQRNLLYTGVTRGKKLVVLVGQKKAFAIAVRNVSGRRRWSKLQEWLRPNPSLSRQIGVAS
jgi:UvrD-like helicase C-terminal domain